MKINPKIRYSPGDVWELIHESLVAVQESERRPTLIHLGAVKSREYLVEEMMMAISVPDAMDSQRKRRTFYGIPVVLDSPGVMGMTIELRK